MRSPIGAALAAAVLLLSGCGEQYLSPDAADPAPRSSEWRPPTQPTTTAAPPASQPASPAAPAAPSAMSDPGCQTEQFARVSYAVDDAYDKGAFDLKGTAVLDRVEVASWWLQLDVVEEAAGLQVYKATVGARDSLKRYLDSPEGGEFARVMATTVRYNMSVLAQRCGAEIAFAFTRPEREASGTP